jgi:hypothetical protein
MNNIKDSNFEGFSPVATSALDIGSEATNDVPKICSGNQNVANFQSIIHDGTDTDSVLLGICSYGAGGMIISTIDVETNSEDANSAEFALLKNMLDYQVNDYPNPFGKMREGTDILINGEVPDPALGAGYATYYMKSNAEITFSYQSDAQVSLQTDWLISGPTSWDLGTMAPGQIDHYVSPLFDTESSPTMTFCKSIGTQGQCKQDEQWTVTLWLHDDNGHSRMLQVTVETNDANADAFNPIADAYVVIKDSYADNINLVGTCSIQDNYPKYEIVLDENGQIPIEFNAGNSSDPDALDDSGIERYEWEVTFDKPWDAPISLNANTYVQYEASEGVWQYTFGGNGVDENGESFAGRNLTFNPNTEAPIQPIKVKLTVYDKSGKWDDDMEFCFDVKPQGFGDEPPVIDYTNWGDRVGYTDSYFNLSGFIRSGSEEKDTFIEITTDESLLEETDFFARETAKGSGQLAVLTSGIGDGDSFELSLNIDSFHSNVSRDVTVYILVYEFDPTKDVEKRWVIEQKLNPLDPDYVELYNPESITLTLPICRGVTVPAEVELNDPTGRWIFVSGQCEWEGDYSLVDGEWVAPTIDDDGDGAQSSSNIMFIGVGVLAIVIIVILTLLFLRKSGSEGMDGDYKDFNLAGAFQQDPVEQYVQQLIAQGYPEDTARSYAQQYAAQAGLAGGAQVASGVAQAAAPAATNPAMDAAYQQYYQQFIAQGYDAQTAAAYAQQYAAQYIQQQG